MGYGALGLDGKIITLPHDLTDLYTLLLAAMMNSELPKTLLSSK